MAAQPYPRERHTPPWASGLSFSANAATRAFRAHPNPCPNPGALRRLGDPARG